MIFSIKIHIPVPKYNTRVESLVKNKGLTPHMVVGQRNDHHRLCR